MNHRTLLAAALLAGAGCQTTTEPQTYSIRFPEAPPSDDSTILDSKLENLEKLAKDYPRRSDYPYQIAGVYYQKENYRESARALQRAIHIDPHEAKYHYHLGRIYLQMRELQKAERSFSKAIELMPPGRYTGGHAALGYVLCQQGRWEPARAQFERCARIDSKDPTPYFFLGCIDDARRDPEGTVSNLQEYLRRGGEVYRKKAAHILESYGAVVPPAKVTLPKGVEAPAIVPGSEK